MWMMRSVDVGVADRARSYPLQRCCPSVLGSTRGLSEKVDVEISQPGLSLCPVTGILP